MADLSPYIAPAVMPLLVIALQSYLTKSRKDAARREGPAGDLILEYGKLMKSLPIFMALVSAVVFPVALHQSPINKENWWGYLFLFAVMVVPTVLVTLMFFGTHFLLTGDGIRKQTPWSDRFIRWNDVKEIHFNGQSFLIASPSGKMVVHLYLTGIRDFAEAVSKNVPEGRLTKAKNEISSILQGR